MDSVEQILTVLRKSSARGPSEDFTERLMARLPAGEYRQIPKQGVHSTNRDCAIGFMISGFFYLILGLALVKWTFPFSILSHSGLWLVLQPALTFVFSATFILISLFLFKFGGRARSVARSVTRLYMVLVVINGLFLYAHLESPSLAPAVTVYVWSGLLLGYLLTSTLGRSSREAIVA